MKSFSVILVVLLVSSAVCRAEQPEARAAIERGVTWLAAQQHADGHWSNETFPALTALPLWALVRWGWDDKAGISNAVKTILSCVHENGAIYRDPSAGRKGGGLANYNTALCMVALHAVGDAKLVPVIERARRYLAGSQHLDSDAFLGGMGYDAKTQRPYTDLSNSYIAFEAMRPTENVEDLRKKGDPRADLNWDVAVKFLQRVHNHPEFNQQPWATDDPKEVGEFAYHPGQTRAGTFTNKDGVVKFRSYGSMSYAGLLSYLYADVKRSDPRVQSTFNWAVNHWTLDENPGVGKEGLFYYYNVLAKGLSAFGQEKVTPSRGEPFLWKEEITKKLVGLQRADPKTGGGFWVNDEGRYWESNPILVTAYTLLALESAMGL